MLEAIQVRGGKAFRYGGEEFIVLLPDTTLEKAIIVAEHIRESISTKKFKNTKTGERLGNITVSLGVSIIRKGDSPISIVERTDAALYKAKESGRNNVKTENEL